MTDEKDIAQETAAAEQTEAEKETLETPEQEQPAEKAEPTAEEIIADLNAKLAEAETQRLLALAEMDNQRKRAAKERENLRANVEQDTLEPFLQVFEHFHYQRKWFGRLCFLDFQSAVLIFPKSELAKDLCYNLMY